MQPQQHTIHTLVWSCIHGVNTFDYCLLETLAITIQLWQQRGQTTADASTRSSGIWLNALLCHCLSAGNPSSHCLPTKHEGSNSPETWAMEDALAPAWGQMYQDTRAAMRPKTPLLTGWHHVLYKHMPGKTAPFTYNYLWYFLNLWMITFSALLYI